MPALGKDAVVGVLQRFERRLGGLVEGTFAKVFKGEVQPVEVAQALQREADDRKAVIAEGRILIPNEYVVELGRHDHARLQPWADPLNREFAAMVKEHATENGYTFVGPVAVRLEEANDIETGAFRIRSDVAEGPFPVETPARQPLPDDAQQGGRPRLVAGNTTYSLTHAVTVIGRARECDLQLDDPGVSRRHAEVRIEGDAVTLVDLGSTNGVRVNGNTVGRHTLQDGDGIELGTTTLVYHRDRAS